MIRIEDDGITHINVYSRGKTLLGQQLSNFSHHPIVLPEHGGFNSVEGFWYWLTRRDDRLRLLSGYDAKKLGRSLPVRRPYLAEEFPMFMEEICSALDAKLRTHRELRLEFARSRLPFVHYYVERSDEGFKMSMSEGSIFLMEHYERRRQQLNPSISFDSIDLAGLVRELNPAPVIEIKPQLSLF
jgi:hypothetical protein